MFLISGRDIYVSRTKDLKQHETPSEHYLIMLRALYKHLPNPQCHHAGQYDKYNLGDRKWYTNGLNIFLKQIVNLTGVNKIANSLGFNLFDFFHWTVQSLNKIYPQY